MQGLSGRMSRARGVARSSGEQGRGFGFCPEFRSTGRIGIFLKKISVVWAGGFLVFEPNFHLGRARVRWAGLLSIFGLAAALVVAALVLAAGLASGLYDIGADAHHTRVVLALIEVLRDRSIAVRAQALAVPPLADAARISAGARRYTALCAQCHLAPGVTQSPLRPGLYPHPPNLAQQQPGGDARRQFWIIKHGIKMSAMPAWGRTLDDAAIWDVVAFVQRLPQLSPDDYQQLSR